MKITGIKVRQVEVPLIEPFRISLGVITHSRSAIVSVETDEGLVGYGEGAPAILISGESLSGTNDVIKAMERELIGVDPTDLEKVYWIMDRTAAHSGSAKNAIDMACYDLLGKKAGMPVYKLLGGHKNFIKRCTYFSFNCIKTICHMLLSFTSFDEDLARVKAIREAVGDDVKIRVDANQAWGAKEAVRLIERLNEYNLELVEQPVPYHDIAGLEYVTKHSIVPIMSDESCFNSKDALRLVERRAIDYLNIKLMKCGGIREALKINAICESAGIEVMLGCMAEESNLGITAAASLGAATKNITRADLDAIFTLTDMPFKGGVIVEDTKKLVLPEVPGFGFIGFENEQ